MTCSYCRGAIYLTHSLDIDGDRRITEKRCPACRGYSDYSECAKAGKAAAIKALTELIKEKNNGKVRSDK